MRARTAPSAAARSASPPVGHADAGERLVEEARGVLGGAEEDRPAAEQPGGDRALERLGRPRVGEPGGEHRRGEAVVGERDQHGVEQPGLARRRRAPGDRRKASSVR